MARATTIPALCDVVVSLTGPDQRFVAGTGALIDRHWALTCAHIALQPLGQMTCLSSTGQRRVELVYLEGERIGVSLRDVASRFDSKLWHDQAFRFEKLALLRLGDSTMQSDKPHWREPYAEGGFVMPVRRHTAISDFQSCSFSGFYSDWAKTSCLVSAERFPAGVNMPVRAGDSGSPVFHHAEGIWSLFAILNCLIQYRDGWRVGSIAASRSKEWQQDVLMNG